MSSGRSRSGDDGDAHDLEAIAQVGAEAPGVDLVGEDAVGGRDEPHVDAAGVALADAPHLAVLDHAQQLGLRARRQLPHLVEEQRAAVAPPRRARRARAPRR